MPLKTKRDGNGEMHLRSRKAKTWDLKAVMAKEQAREAKVCVSKKTAYRKGQVLDSGTAVKKSDKTVSCSRPDRAR